MCKWLPEIMKTHSSAYLHTYMGVVMFNDNIVKVSVIFLFASEH